MVGGEAKEGTPRTEDKEELHGAAGTPWRDGSLCISWHWSRYFSAGTVACGGRWPENRKIGEGRSSKLLTSIFCTTVMSMNGPSATCDDNKSWGRGVWSKVVSWVDIAKEGGEESKVEIKNGRRKMFYLKCFKYLSLFVCFSIPKPVIRNLYWLATS